MVDMDKVEHYVSYNKEFKNMLAMKKMLDSLFESPKEGVNWHIEVEQCCRQMLNSSLQLRGE